MIHERNTANLGALKNIKAISFDLDDTFWDCAPAIVQAEETLYLWLEQRYPAVMENTSREHMREQRAAMYQTHPHLSTDVTMMRKAFLQQLFEHDANAEQIAEQAFAVFYKSRSQVVLYEGAHEILRALQDTHRVAAITNGNADLDLIGLSHYFQDIQSASLDNPPKPARDMFDRCCQNLGVAADELLHVGDNPQTDVMGAHNAGVRTVWFNQMEAIWPEQFSRPDFEVKSLPELQHLLSQFA